MQCAGFLLKPEGNGSGCICAVFCCCIESVFCVLFGGVGVGGVGMQPLSHKFRVLTGVATP